MADINYYHILGLDKTADAADIKKAYKKLAMKYHPDRNTNDPTTAEGKFKELQEAYGVLSDPQKRSNYDRYGSASGPSYGPSMSDMHDFFRNHTARQEQVIGCSITVEESILGCVKDVEYVKVEDCPACSGQGYKTEADIGVCTGCNGKGHRPFPAMGNMTMICPGCQGSGKIITNPCNSCSGHGTLNKSATVNIRIPAGIPDTAAIRANDFIVRIHIVPHTKYVRKGMDLWVEQEIDCIDAMTGTSFMFDTIKGEKLKVQVKPGTQPNTVMKFDKKGADFQGTVGHMYVSIKVNVPTITNEQQDELKRLFGK
jgi:molecular chaperone DnaJ